MTKVGVLVRWVLVVVVLSTVICTDTQAAKKGKGPKPFRTQKCEEVVKSTSGETPVVHEFRIKKNRKSLTLRIPGGSSQLPAYVGDTVCLELLNEKGKRILGPVLVSSTCFLNGVRHADLNGDGKQDFVVSMYIDSVFSDNQAFREAFVLSAKDGYHVTVMHTRYEGTHFVDLTGDGKAQIIQRTLVFGDTPVGDPERFYVDNIYEFKGGKIVLANQLLAGYPKWWKVNRKEGGDLPADISQEKKDQLWAKNEHLIFWEVDDEYKQYLKQYWGKVFKDIDKLDDPDLSAEDKEKRLREILKDAYERTHPVSMTAEEKDALFGPRANFKSEEVRKFLKDISEEGKPPLEKIMSTIANLENPSEKDKLFLYRFLDPIARAIAVGVMMGTR